MNKHNNLFALITILFSFAATACMGGAPSKPADNGSHTACDAGDSKDCSCVDGSNGAQVCKTDGSSYANCICDGSDDHVCTPGDSHSCGCDDGRSGSQSCKSDGSGFGSCACTGPVPNMSSVCTSDNGCAANRICVNGECLDQNTGSSGCNSNADCKSPRICVSGGCEVPPGTDTSGLESVTISYTLPNGAPMPKQVLLKAGIKDFVQDLTDMCNSNNQSGSVALFARSGNTYSCTLKLPSNWRDGNYNVEVNVGDENIAAVPDHTAIQYNCYEQFGKDRPSGCTSGCYALYGTIVVGGITMSASCHHWNNLTVGGCNTTPAQCG